MKPLSLLSRLSARAGPEGILGAPLGVIASPKGSPMTCLGAARVPLAAPKGPIKIVVDPFSVRKGMCKIWVYFSKSYVRLHGEGQYTLS